MNGIPEVSNWGVVLKDGTLLPGFSSSAAAQEHIKSLELEGAAVRPLGQNNRQIPLCPSCWKPKEG